MEQEFVPLVMVHEHLTKLSYQCQVQTQMSWVCMACSFADELLRNLWRWLGSPDSALQSPALRQAVRGLMKKMLAQLVATLKKLGARVIAADASSVTLATGKRNLTAAVGCVSLHLYMSLMFCSFKPVFVRLYRMHYRHKHGQQSPTAGGLDNGRPASCDKVDRGGKGFWLIVSSSALVVCLYY